MQWRSLTNALFTWQAFLSTYCVLDTVFCAGSRVENKTKTSAPVGLWWQAGLGEDYKQMNTGHGSQDGEMCFGEKGEVSRGGGWALPV